MSHEFRTLLLVSREIASNDSLEALGVGLRHRVPELGRSKMDVVDRIQVGVLDVPSDFQRPESATLTPPKPHIRRKLESKISSQVALHIPKYR